MKLKLGLCQMNVTADKEANLRHARELLTKAAAGGAELAMLPEMFNCPYENAAFPVYAEPAGGESWQALSAAARDNGLWLVGGSVPELAEGKIYNTSYIFDPKGNEVARHRKVHLFDIDVPGGQRFKESDTLAPGDQITLVDTPWGKVGVAICFDIRFAELFRIMGNEGAALICVPAAFNMTTGPAHWDLTFRMRAIDQQCFVAGCSPARNETASYVAYGNSLVADPWGAFPLHMDEKEHVHVVELDLDDLAKYRGQIPILSGQRTDLYRTQRQK